MQKTVTATIAGAALFALILSGCGSSSSGGGGTTTGKPGFSKGVVASRTSQSVSIAGVDYKTTGASISIDGVSGPESELKVGKVTQVKGSRNDDGVSGEGAEIEYDDNLEGMITALTATTLTVFGQTVVVDANTVFAGTTGMAGASPLATGNVVEVSGFPTANGSILATYIERRTGVTVFEIKGLVSNYTGSTTFTLTPASSSAPISITLGAGVTVPSGFGNGKRVEVWTADVNAGTSITATKVELAIELEPAENDEAEVEGTVTSYTSISSFIVNGVTVNAGSAAISGGTAADIMLNAKVEAEGTFTGGTLVAKTVKLKTSW